MRVIAPDNVVSFPDTDSEYVDVGIGMVKVAETPYQNICRVVKRGKGLSLQLIACNTSETFSKYERKGKNRDLIPLSSYLEYFGTYNTLLYVCTWEEYNMTDEQLENEYL